MSFDVFRNVLFSYELISFLIAFQENMLEILKCLQFGSATKAYSPIVRLFCFTVNYFSPKAYEYIREYFHRNIPGVRTLRSWYSSLDGSPGFTDESFDALKQKVEEAKANGITLVCGLIFDEMSIRKLCQWDQAKKEFTGHITEGKENQYDVCTPLAKFALVFMISGINVQFKIPIGYFFVNKLTGQAKAALISEAMYRLSLTGLKLASVTFDGDCTNISAVKILGACFVEGKTFFENTYDGGSRVYVVLDPPHMLKLSRNILGNKKEIIDQNDEIISWKFIDDLVVLQTTENVNLGNKLTKTHSNYKNMKMNVKIAAQTLSNSTADSIEYLDTHAHHEKFQNSGATTSYMRIINNLFDTMNTKEGHCNEQYKRPFSEETKDVFLAYFEHAAQYIQGLKVMEDGFETPILDSKSFTGYFGFSNNMSSFMGIYNDHIKPNGIDKFFTFGVSQDHVESFFGCIRRMNGCNDNPSIQQFKAAYRKLLFQNEVTTSSKSNCENDVTKILSVSSHRRVSPVDNLNELELLVDIDLDDLHNIDDDVAGNNIGHSLQENSRAYLAGIVEQNVINKITRRGKNKCLHCINVFGENELTNDRFIDFKSQGSNIFIPCRSTLSIIDTIENYLSKYETQQVSYITSVNQILNNIDASMLYELSDFGLEHDHKNDLIKLVIIEYLDKKSMAVGRIVTRLTQEKLIRHKNLKLVHNAGQ